MSSTGVSENWLPEKNVSGLPWQERALTLDAFTCVRRVHPRARLRRRPAARDSGWPPCETRTRPPGGPRPPSPPLCQPAGRTLMGMPGAAAAAPSRRCSHCQHPRRRRERTPHAPRLPGLWRLPPAAAVVSPPCRACEQTPPAQRGCFELTGDIPAAVIRRAPRASASTGSSPAAPPGVPSAATAASSPRRPSLRWARSEGVLSGLSALSWSCMASAVRRKAGGSPSRLHSPLLPLRSRQEEVPIGLLVVAEAWDLSRVRHSLKRLFGLAAPHIRRALGPSVAIGS